MSALTNVELNFIEGASLKNANLDGSQMARVNLRVACLKNAILRNCDLKSAVLAGADLEVRECAHVNKLCFVSVIRYENFCSFIRTAICLAVIYKKLTYEVLILKMPRSN